MDGDKSEEFVFGYWGLKGKNTFSLWLEKEQTRTE